MHILGEVLNSIPNHGGMSITSRLHPLPYANKDEGDIILQNLSMGRDEILGDNDLCVCGSGKAKSKCHRDISKDSLVFKLWEKYLAYDREVERLKKENNVDFYCSSIECSECCSEYFYISAIEYFLIKNHIKEILGRRKFEKIASKCKEAMRQLKLQFPDEFAKLTAKPTGIASTLNDKEHLERLLPCPLLDNHGRCEYYQARPLICRFFGTSYLYSACTKIKEHLHSSPTDKTENLMVGISYSEKYQENVDTLTLENGGTILQRPYPLIYFLAYDAFFEANYILATQGSVNEYISRQI